MGPKRVYIAYDPIDHIHLQLLSADAEPLVGIPSSIRFSLSKELSNSTVLQSNTQLRDLFIDANLIEWRNSINEATSIQDRIDSLINVLWSKHDRTGNNALVLFLKILGQREGVLGEGFGELAQQLEAYLSADRADDTGPRAWTEHIKRNLKDSGYHVYTCPKAPATSSPFDNQSRQDIITADRFILVYGLASAQSDWVTEQWRLASEHCRSILVLVLNPGSSDDSSLQVPAELNYFRCVDVHKGQDYTSVWQEIKQFLDDDRSRPTSPPLVEPLPSHCIPRQDVLLKLDGMLDRRINWELARNGHTTRQAVVLYGDPGSGKTTAAAMFATKCRTRIMFSDGIFWLTVGPDPKDNQILDHLKTIGMKFGENIGNYYNNDVAISCLSNVLYEKRCLFILDDIWEWDSKHIRYLRSVCGPHSRMLITSRVRHVTHDSGAESLLIPSLTPDQSVSLLRLLAEHDDPLFPRIANRLGHLPLTLRIVGEYLQRKDSASLLEQLQQRRSPTFSKSRAQASIKIFKISQSLSVDAVFQGDERKKLLYYAFAIFRPGIRMPRAAVGKLWRSMSFKLNEQDCDEWLDALVDWGLLNVDNGSETYGLHDLQRDYCCDHLEPGQEVELQNLVLRAYNPDNRPWHTIANDGYIYQNLAYHLIQAERTDELCKLLFNFAWLETKLLHTDAAELIADVTLVINALDASQTNKYLHPLKLLKSSLNLSAHVLAEKPNQLWSQLYGRLMEQDNGLVQTLLSAPYLIPWLQPLKLCLVPPEGPLIQILQGHRDGISSLAISANGEVALSASYDGTIKVWQPAHGTLLYSWRGHELGVMGVALNAAGTLAVSGGCDCCIRTWNLTTHQELHYHSFDYGTVMSIAMSADGAIAIAGFQSGAIVIWDVASGNVMHVREEHRGAVLGVALSQDGTMAVSGSYDRTMRVWDVPSGRVLHVLDGHGDAVDAVALYSNGSTRIAASGGGDYKARVWDLNTGKILHTFSSDTGRIKTLLLSSDGKRIIVGGYKGVLKIRDVVSGEKITELRGHGRYATAAASSGSGLLLSGGYDTTLLVWDLQNQQPLPPFLRSGHPIRYLATSRDGQLLVSTSDHKDIQLWDPQQRQHHDSLKGTHDAHAVAVSNDGAYIVTGNFDSTVTLWDVSKREIVRTFTGHTRASTAVAISPDARIVVSGADGRNEQESCIKVWDATTGAELRNLTGHTSIINELAINNDGTMIVSASGDNAVCVWDLESGALLHRLVDHQHIVKSVVISDDGRFIYSGSCDKTIKIWSTATGQLLHTLVGHNDYVWSVRLSPHQNALVSVSEDHTVKIWSLATMSMIAEFYCENVLFTCAILPKNTIVVSGLASNEPHFLKLRGVEIS